MSSLLSLDFDMFFPIYPNSRDWYLYDWGQNENFTPYLNSFLWHTRASAFMTANGELPGLSGDEEGFWSRFSFSQCAKLYIADSHGQILSSDVTRHIHEVWNFDAHHDCGYNSSAGHNSFWQIDCSNWAEVFWKNSQKVHIRYPSWRENNGEGEQPDNPVFTSSDVQIFSPEEKFPTFDRIFICRSGAWTPPWLDEEFDKIVDECPIADKIYLEPVEPRSFDMNIVEQLMEQESRIRGEL